MSCCYNIMTQMVRVHSHVLANVCKNSQGSNEAVDKKGRNQHKETQIVVVLMR